MGNKKKNKANQDAKPRIDCISGVTKEVVSHLSFTLHEDDTIEFHELDPESMCLSRQYSRESGKDKILISQPGRSSRMSFDSLKALKAAYDHILAVDTNTAKIGDKHVSVTVAYYVPGVLSSWKYNVPFKPLCAFVTLGIKQYISPEKFGWHQIISRRPKTDPDTIRIGMVVDSALGEIKSFNAREAPYYLTNILPSYLSFIYASDAASDTLPNQMIKFCDTAGSQIIRDLAANPEKLENIDGGGTDYDGIAEIAIR